MSRTPAPGTRPRSYSGVLLAVILFLVVLLTFQVGNQNRTREHMDLLERENAVVRELRHQAEELGKERDYLKQQMAGVRKELDRWKRRCREKDEQVRKLQVDLTRGATEVREARAALDMVRKASK
ncbi:MAG: hypothetical protein HN742_21030 [Lentisphaerae bacterium]|jgi:biopolymer transport protein ExbB/TolQ|nr:hypothetical protein [Lentisphaerota bacterium]MBT5604468.1 hypothetical protein [Lentisphaerota bacterium]MBT7060469.1 hypothetical protein [Lentisphaerota bacterium]MBT7844376.1 hypothetical protein [Lentisphaerota bacterium]